MEPEEAIILTDILALSEARDADVVPTVELFLQAHPGAEGIVAKLAAQLGEPDVSLPDTERTLQAIRAQLHQRGVPLCTEVGARTPETRGGATPAADAERSRQKFGGLVAHPLRWIVRTAFAELAGRAVVALLGRKASTVTVAEIERLRVVVDQAETEDE